MQNKTKFPLWLQKIDNQSLKRECYLEFNIAQVGATGNNKTDN